MSICWTNAVPSRFLVKRQTPKKMVHNSGSDPKIFGSDPYFFGSGPYFFGSDPGRLRWRSDG
jgi:hypothetical protein